MILAIEISCTDEDNMENNLNMAISDFSDALSRRGFSEMELAAYNKTTDSKPIYKIILKK